MRGNQSRAKKAFTKSSSRIELDWSLYQLGHIRTSIQQSERNDHQIRQEIKIERNLSKKLHKQVGVTFNHVEDNAAQFSAKLEEEKNKHQALMTLVNHHKKEIHQNKRERSENKATKKESQEFEYLKSQLHNLEGDLDAISIRSNAALYQVQKDQYVVKAERSQRTVISNLMNKLEMELLSLSLKYKQLLIERIGCDKQFQECTKQFQDFRKRGEGAVSEFQQNKPDRSSNCLKSQRKREDDEISQIHTKHTQKVRITMEKLEKSYRERQRDVDRLKSINRFKENKELEKLQLAKTVKEIFYSLGIQSSSELPSTFLQLETEIEQNYATVNGLVFYKQNLEDKIQKAQEKRYKMTKRKQPEPLFRRNYNHEIDEVSQEIMKQKDQMNAFSESLQLKQLFSVFCIDKSKPVNLPELGQKIISLCNQTVTSNQPRSRKMRNRKTKTNKMDEKLQNLLKLADYNKNMELASKREMQSGAKRRLEKIGVYLKDFQTTY